MHGRVWAVILLLGALLVSCADMASWRDSCFSHSDCSEGARCILGVCTEVPDFEVDIEIIPASPSDHLSYPVRAVDLDHLDALSIIVPPPRIVRGRVHHEQKPYEGAARVSFTAETGLRRSLRYFADITGESDPPGSFEVKLVGSMLDGGGTEPIGYAVSAWPINATECCLDEAAICPVPVTMSGMRFRTDTDDLVLAFPERPTRISGRVILGPEDAELPHPMRVQAWAQSGSSYSLAVDTDEDGHFCVALDLPEKGSETTVRFRVGPVTTGLVVPVVEHTIEVISGQTASEIELALGGFGEPVELKGEILDRDDEPIDGAHVSFSGQVATGGTFSAATVSRTDGSFALGLLPGTYDVRIVPPEGSKASIVEVVGVEVDRATAGRPQAFFSQRATPRALLSGMVVGPGSERLPVAEVEVIAEFELVSISGSAARIDRFTTWTDDEGRFSIHVDPGSYRLHFRPPVFSGLPWVVGPIVEMSATAPHELPVVLLEEPSAFDGKVLGEIEGGKTVPLTNARVEVHARRRDRTHLLWEGRASEDGSFRVLLPRSLTSKVETSLPPEDPDHDDPW